MREGERESQRGGKAAKHRRKEEKSDVNLIMSLFFCFNKLAAARG